MRKKISLVVLTNSGSSTRHLTIPAAVLRFFVLGCLVAVGFLGYDYYHLKSAANLLQNKETMISSQMDEIVRQRKQIQEFADEIDSLKSKLVDLNDFEKKIRIIANIEKPEDQYRRKRNQCHGQSRSRCPGNPGDSGERRVRRNDHRVGL